MKNSLIHEKCNLALIKISNGAYLFDSNMNDIDLNKLALYVKTHILPIITNKQHVESKIKDISLCKITNRLELTTTHMHYVCS